MIQSFEQRKSAFRACPCASLFGGGGSSSSASSTTNNNTDARVVGGNDSVNLSVHNSDNLQVIATDHGAVAAGMQLGTQAIDAARNNSAAAINAGSDMFAKSVAAVNQSSDKLALAYQSGQAGDQTSLKYVGFIVVGLAAVSIFGKK